MKNKLLVIALLGYSVIALWGCAKREVKNIDSQGKNIICFGDSITLGCGVNPGQDYPFLLAGMVHMPVINAGIDGDTSPEALGRLETDVLAQDPLLVIIEFGGNDFLRKIPKEVTISKIREMVDNIQAKGAMAAIMDMSAGMFMENYRSAFRKLAQEKSAIFLPGVVSEIITNPKLKSDFIHPNEKGYKMIAQRIYRIIIPYLQQNAILRKPQEQPRKKLGSSK